MTEIWSSQTFDFAMTIRAKAKERVSFSGKHAYKREKTREFEESLGYLFRANYKNIPLKGPIFISVGVHLARPKKSKYQYPRRGDVDNFVKSVFDAANKIVWEDDCQVVCQTAYKAFGHKDSIVIDVREVGEVRKFLFFFRSAIVRFLRLY